MNGGGKRTVRIVEERICGGLRALPIVAPGQLQWKVSLTIRLPVTDSLNSLSNGACKGLLKKTAPHPEIESVPRLFLRVDAVGLDPADGPDVGLMALFEVDELEEDRRIRIKMLEMYFSV